jgi:hypothetical protein
MSDQGTVNFSLALAIDLARMGLWPDGVKFSEATDNASPATDPEGDAVDQAVEAWERDVEAWKRGEGGSASPQEQFSDPAYLAYEAWLDGRCNRSYVMGPAHDPSATYCDLDAGHSGKHEGDSPFGEGRIRWNGGGAIEGDPLPINDVEFVEVQR